jgi:hypothetical protein
MCWPICRVDGFSVSCAGGYSWMDRCTMAPLSERTRPDQIRLWAIRLSRRPQGQVNVLKQRVRGFTLLPSARIALTATSVPPSRDSANATATPTRPSSTTSGPSPARGTQYQARSPWPGSWPSTFHRAHPRHPKHGGVSTRTRAPHHCAISRRHRRPQHPASATVQATDARLAGTG